MHISLLLILLLQIGLVLLLSRLMGMLFAHLHQPQVMGEMVAGIMLGPSLFGWLAPYTWAWVFRPDTLVGSGIHVDPTQYLGVLSQIGVIFFLFLIGLELDPKLIRNRGHAAIVISHASIVAPFLLGVGLTLYLFPRVFNNAPHMQFTAVALFMGAAMSITAFPVLARILTERNLHKTKVGAITITCAAVDDVTAWCLLAFVVAIARANGLHPAMMTAMFSIAYVLAMFFIIRPLLGRIQAIYARQGRLSQNVVAVIFLLVLASAYVTEIIGIHALFGAFLMGAIMPKGTQFVRHLSEKLEDYTVVFLLPIFFAYTGLQTRIGLINNADLWLDTGLIIAVACLGKFGGSTIAAKACGLQWREASAIGILMNTRGLMELVILNIGRELGVITDAVFAMMVIMALVTTALTTPILSLVYPSRLFGAGREKPANLPAAGEYPILIPVANPRSAAPLLELADALGAPASHTARLFALNLRRPVEHEAYRSGLDETEAAPPPIEAMLEKADGAPVETFSFVSRDISTDIVRVATAWRVRLILMGFHKPVISQSILGGTVHRVLTSAPCDVGIFVDRGYKQGTRILVPYLGGIHDQLALELAGRMCRNTNAAVTVLHIASPQGRAAGGRSGTKKMVEKIFADPTQTSPVTFRVIEDPSPVDAVLREAANFDLIVIGVAEEWGLESHLLGFRPERIAQESTASLLIVRKQETLSPSPIPHS